MDRHWRRSNTASETASQSDREAEGEEEGSRRRRRRKRECIIWRMMGISLGLMMRRTRRGFGRRALGWLDSRKKPKEYNQFTMIHSFIT